MFRKSFQNILLVISVLTAFVLAYEIWFGSYFLPEGQEHLLSGINGKFMQPILSLFGTQEETDFSENLHKLFKPDKIVLNNAGNRLVFLDDSEKFQKIRSISNEVIKDSMLGNCALKSREIVTTEAYLSALKGKSIYVDYGQDCDYRLFSYGISEKEKNRFAEDLSVVRGYIIGLHEGILNDISLYFSDQKSGTVYRYIVEADKENLLKELDEFMVETNSSTDSYSFELNFHKEQEEAVTKVLFDPILLMNLTPVHLSSLQSKSDGIDGLLKESNINSILDAFSINNHTLRKYTDLNNARVFVENNATLTLYPEGMLVYQCVPGGRGPDISNQADKTNYTIYDALADGVDFVEHICRELSPSLYEHLQINSDLTENQPAQGTYRFSFDYTVNGVPIQHKVGEEYAHTVEIEIENGYLKSYRQFFKHYEPKDESKELTAMLTVADQLVDMMYSGEQPLFFKSISPCYVDSEDGNLKPVWRVVVDGKEMIVE